MIRILGNVYLYFLNFFRIVIVNRFYDAVHFRFNLFSIGHSAIFYSYHGTFFLHIYFSGNGIAQTSKKSFLFYRVGNGFGLDVKFFEVEIIKIILFQFRKIFTDFKTRFCRKLISRIRQHLKFFELRRIFFLRQDDALQSRILITVDAV